MGRCEELIINLKKGGMKMISIVKTINNDFVIVKSEDQEHYWSGSKWSDQDDAVIYKTWDEASIEFDKIT